MGKRYLPEKIELQHDFDRLASKKLAYVYQLLIPDNFPKQEGPVSKSLRILKQN